jgi:hypothetical protein
MLLGPDEIARRIQQRHRPGWAVWYGRATGHYWALASWVPTLDGRSAPRHRRHSTRRSPSSRCSTLSPGIHAPMLWSIEESHDCGVTWRRAELAYCHGHSLRAPAGGVGDHQRRVVPPERSLRQLAYALAGESVAHFWERGIRVVRVDLAARYPLVGTQLP